MLLRIVFICVLSVSGIAQEPVSVLMDSLANTSSEKEKSRISLSIASHLKNDDWDRALYYLEIAKRNALNSASEKTLADYYKAAGDLFFSKDALDIALNHYLKAYDYYQNQPLADTSIALEQNLAVVYGRIKEPTKARTYFRKLLSYAKKERDSVLLAKILNNLGTSYLNSNIDSATYYYKRSENLLKTIPNEMQLKAYLYGNLGRTYFLRDSLDKAQKYFDLAVNYIEKDTIERPQSKGWVYNTVSTYYERINQLDSTIVYATKANEALSESQFSFENQAALQTLYKTYLKKDDFKNAAEYFQKYDAVRDSLNLEDKAANVEKIKVEQEYKNKEEIRDLRESKQRFRNYIIFLVLLAVLLLLGILLVRFRNKLRNTKLEKQLVEAKQKELDSNLQLKNKELIGKAMVEIHRTEIIEEILQDLKEVKRKAAKKETQKAIDYIAKRLKRDTNSNIWKEFEMRFEQVHESFYKNLSEKHPDLTSKDKRLCALLKLNLTSKEIAQITGQSSKSIENARTRLRKKLDITHSDVELSAYLSSFGK
ncbi:tetratricopeptide repeat protein [Marixanthomonas spongiae]|uniref:HTH luxR-type domain-containing protein n=1 Tax=Marixanthomonas spongiae TaxID=2174845 RepID=A0A2U0I862_9FLAO|nr:tetratricopeptide repeat protein [Marixanthomonas spongiae]PVW17291.1 hypothetical protein DDV96_01920 [Marixanthomonas spongiae]